ELFVLMKWAGALYLIYLGLMQWRSAPALDKLEVDNRPVSGLSIFVRAFTVTFLNPKGVIFYIAFMPQFIVTDAPVLPQMLILGATFIVLVFPINTAYALLSGTMREAIQNRRVLRTLNQTGGAMLIGAGILTASLKRT
ncbi:MAG TPA: LysE family transporter, partial [Anaerolineae bacterium]